jgi:hypothetical protein
MARVPTLSALRRRFNQLAAAVGEAREQARNAHMGTQALQSELARMRELQEALTEQVQHVSRALTLLDEQQSAEQRVAQTFRSDVIHGLRRVHAEEAWHRRRLRDVRDSADYDRAFSDPEPLISVLIPTYERLDTLRSRAIPSVLAQEYRNFEIVVVGDAAPYGADEILAGFGDAPIRYVNLAARGPYPPDARRRWLVAGTTPYNEAMHLARGAWIAPFADDDAMRPHHLRVLLERARTDRLEFVYGLLMSHPSGDAIGSFPPRLGDIGLQGALLHGGLAFFELELADADFDIPGDWACIERMLRAGVRVGMVQDVLVDYFPGMKATGSDPP